MGIRAAINGYGRIGRALMRALLDRPSSTIDIVAINDPSRREAIAHLTSYDSTHGKLGHSVISLDEHSLRIGRHEPVILNCLDPSQWPWRELDVDLVFECTGTIVKKQWAYQHLQRGARKVLISAPSPEAEITVVYGINHQDLLPHHTLVSNASCTTNCLAHIAMPLLDTVGIISGFLNTVHAYTNDQKLLDAHHTDLRRARTAYASMIPTKTGAAKTLGIVIPQLSGKIDGLAIRVPTPNVSMIDFTFVPEQACTREEVMNLLREASEAKPKLLYYTTEPLVSSDWNHCPASAIVDAPLTQVLPQLVKVCAWYDNEWGFAQRLIDTAQHMYA